MDMLRARSNFILLILVGACDDGRPEVEPMPISAAHRAVVAAAPVELAAASGCGRWSSNDPCEQRWLKGPVHRSVRGPDDRADLYCLDSASTVKDAAKIREVARASMAIFEENDLERNAVTGAYTIKPGIVTLKDDQEPWGSPYCEDEVFAAQPRGAACSGVLIAGPRILSAKHCLKKDRLYVFGFAMKDAQSLASLEFKPEEVCRPRKGASRQVFNDEVGVLDIECDADLRVAPAQVAADLYQSCAPWCEPGEDHQVYAIGYPEELPAKFSGWSDVFPVEPGIKYFSGALDLMPGNSGSPVFNARHEIVGVVNDDGKNSACKDDAAGCRRWRSCPRVCSDRPKIYFVTSSSIPPSQAPEMSVQ